MRNWFAKTSLSPLLRGFAFASLFVALLVVAFAAPADAQLVDMRGKTPRESCIASCNRDYEVCMDETSNSREALHGTGRTMNAGRVCDASLSNCMIRCRAAGME